MDDRIVSFDMDWLKNKISLLIRTKALGISVNQNKGKLKENLSFQNAVPMQLTNYILSLSKETQWVCKMLLESSMVMEILLLNCADLTQHHSMTQTYCKMTTVHAKCQHSVQNSIKLYQEKEY
jgi:hypothetical protein